LGNPYYDAELRDELLAMAVDTKQARDASPEVRRDISTRLADRMWEILDDYDCWPGNRVVGADGAEAAWFVVQDAIEDPALQERCLDYLDVAVAIGDADPVHAAYLSDRVRMAEGRKQLYGSQFVIGADGSFGPWPFDDRHAVDRRRQRLGLCSFAEHEARMRAEFETRSDR
jgi:hypothetical protein